MTTPNDVRRQGEAQGLNDEQIAAAIQASEQDPKLTPVEAVTKAMKQSQSQSNNKEQSPQGQPNKGK